LLSVSDEEVKCSHVAISTIYSGNGIYIANELPGTIEVDYRFSQRLANLCPELHSGRKRYDYLKLDFVQLLIFILEKSPWIRKDAKGLERFENNRWSAIPREDLAVVSKIEGQVMLK
jgi:hypothetical protein